MQRMGGGTAGNGSRSSSRRSFDQLFNAKLSTSDVEALDDLFPATKPKAGRTGRRPLAVVA